MNSLLEECLEILKGKKINFLSPPKVLFLFSKRRNPKKWAKAKRKAISKTGKWSAYTAGLAVKYYKESGGGYVGKKDKSLNKAIKKVQKEE
ncbi:MAG: hypothetical protein CV045_02870 [Cyanobacteria bacterium M5B4]|nr:MAG: hypothetical protein CV045_02870 [Cyanobacteria bacterium M5B4]